MRPELDRALQTLSIRFGGQAVTAASRLSSPEPWVAGIEAVERLTGIGGLPRGRISVLQGRFSSGKASLGLALLAQATRSLAQAMVIDTGWGFDPWAMMPFDPDLGELTVVRPPHAAAAGEAAIALARAGAGFLLLPLPERVAAGAEAWLDSLAAAASRSGSLVVVTVEAPPRALAHASSVTLALERTGWVRERGLLVGLRASVHCVKNKVAAPGAAAELEFRYPLGATIFPAGPVREVVPGERRTEAGWSAAV